MPRQKPFDKRTATTYALVHRPQHDPLIHDDTISSHVFTEISGPSSLLRNSKIKQRGDLEEEFGLSDSVRANEGEAAEHGIYYDDSNYDYMQHMRELGGGAEAMWVEAPQVRQKGRGKGKQTLEDALRNVDLDDEDDAISLGGISLAESRSARATGKIKVPTYQDQQDVPDILSGLQPDMDPRLREVLEALDDEAYVDDEDDIFAELAGDKAEEVAPEEWGGILFDDEEDGWESDATTKPAIEYKLPTSPNSIPSQPPPTISDPPTASSIPPPTSTTDGDWLASFAKSKLPSSTTIPRGNPTPADLASSSLLSTSTSPLGGRRKKRKGALTSTSAFSMTSSALARTEPLTLLDSRFDRLAESYMDDDAEDENEDNDDTASVATASTNASRASYASNLSGTSKASRWSQASGAPQLLPAGFDGVMDEFLGGSNAKGKGRRMRKGGSQGIWGQQSGMEQLNEIRNGLGPARVN